MLHPRKVWTILHGRWNALPFVKKIHATNVPSKEKRPRPNSQIGSRGITTATETTSPLLPVRRLPSSSGDRFATKRWAMNHLEASNGSKFKNIAPFASISTRKYSHQTALSQISMFYKGDSLPSFSVRYVSCVSSWLPVRDWRRNKLRGE